MTRASSDPTSLTNAPTALGLPRAYWLLWLGMLVNRLGGTVFPFLAIYLTQQRGMSPAAAGLTVGAYAAGGCLAGPTGGALADRFGRRTMLVVASVAASATMLALGLARTTLAIAALAPVLGFTNDLARPALHAVVADVVAPADRRRAYGLLYWAINLGFAGAAIGAGTLAQHGFTLLFVVDAATTLAFGIMVVLGLPETNPTSASASPAERPSLALAFRDARFRPFFAIQVLVLLVFQQGLVSMPLDMAAHGLAPARIGALLALNGLVIVALQPFALRLTRAIAHVRLLAIGAALTGIGFGAAALFHGATGYGTSIAVFTLGEIAFSMAAPALLADLAPAWGRATYQGAYQLAWSFAGIAAPTLGPFVLERAGANALWGGCFAVGVAATWLHLTVTAGRLVTGR